MQNARKRRKGRLLKVAIMMLTILMTTTNCDNEIDVGPPDINPVHEAHGELGSSNNKISHVDAEDIPEIINLIDPSLKNQRNKSSVVSADFGKIKIKDILKSVDLEGNTNYSFEISPKKAKENSVFNLVVNTNTEPYKIAIFEYRMTPEFAADYNNGVKDFGQFSGNIVVFPYVANSKVFHKSSVECTDTDLYTKDCYLISVADGSGTGGGPGDTDFEDHNTYTGGNGADINHDYGGTTVTYYCSLTGTTDYSPAECLGGVGGVSPHGGYYVIRVEHDNVYKMNNTKSKSAVDCCSDVDWAGLGDVPVTLTETARVSILVCMEGENLSKPQVDWVMTDGHPLEVSGVGNYLKSFGSDVCNPNANQGFSKSAIDAYRAGGLVDWIDKIIELLSGKEKCVHDHLSGVGADDYVKNILSKFQGTSEFDLQIESVPTLGGNIAGTTFPPSDGVIVIKIASDIARSVATGRGHILKTAHTILHEYIHADMFRKLNTKYSGDLEFKKTWDKYKTQKQHSTMAELYIDEMRDALKLFHKNVIPAEYNDNSRTDTFYEAMAWQGLKIHNIKAWQDLSAARKNEINNTYTLYIHGLTRNCP